MRAVVTITGFNVDNYSKRLAIVSNQQIHVSDTRMRDAVAGEATIPGAITFDPKDFPEVDRFVVTVELQ